MLHQFCTVSVQGVNPLTQLIINKPITNYLTHIASACAHKTTLTLHTRHKTNDFIRSGCQLHHFKRQQKESQLQMSCFECYVTTVSSGHNVTPTTQS